MASPSFADLGVSRPVVDALARRDITTPFAVQELVMADALAGRDLLVKSPTGSGKTLAFGIPLVDRLAGNAPATPPSSWRRRASSPPRSRRRSRHRRALAVWPSPPSTAARASSARRATRARRT